MAASTTRAGNGVEHEHEHSLEQEPRRLPSPDHDDLSEKGHSAHGRVDEAHTDEHSPDQSDNDISTLPDDPIHDFDWTQFEEEYHSMVQTKDREEESLRVEFANMAEAR